MDARSVAVTAANGGRITAADEVGYEYECPEFNYDETAYKNRIYQGFGKGNSDEKLICGPNIKDWPEMPPLNEHMLLKVCAWKDKIGGIMQYGIPEFRLPKSVLDRYKKKMLEMGIRIRPNTTIGTVLKIDDLLRDGYASVFVGTGVWKARNLGIHGECLGNVHFGIDYLANVKAYNLGEKVAIIGMGNAAMDVARTVLRNGARKVTLYARGKTVTASSHEMSYAQLDGAEFVFGKEIQRITEKGPVFKNTILDENDRVIGCEEEEEQVEADSVIICISQGPRGKLIRTTAGLEGTEKGLLVVDENGMTTKEGVFAAGDVVHGSKTVVHAVEGAKRAAESMIRYMENLSS